MGYIHRGYRGYGHIGTLIRSCRYMGAAIKVHGYGHAGTWVRSRRDMGTAHGGVGCVRGTVRGEH